MKKISIKVFSPESAKKLGIKMRRVAYPSYVKRPNMARTAKNALLLGATTEQVIKIWRRYWPDKTSGSSAVAQHRGALRKEGYVVTERKQSIPEILGTGKARPKLK